MKWSYFDSPSNKNNIKNKNVEISGGQINRWLTGRRLVTPGVLWYMRELKYLKMVLR